MVGVISISLLTWREGDLDDSADGAVAADDLDLVQHLGKALVEELDEAERAVDLPQLGGRDAGHKLVALCLPSTPQSPNQTNHACLFVFRKPNTPCMSLHSCKARSTARGLCNCRLSFPPV